jgi:hypothetical protein
MDTIGLMRYCWDLMTPPETWEGEGLRGSEFFLYDLSRFQGGQKSAPAEPSGKATQKAEIELPGDAAVLIFPPLEKRGAKQSVFYRPWRLTMQRPSYCV